MAQAAHEKWLQRNALLTEIEQAVRNERQLHAKENRMRESKRREKTILEREILPGQFLCSFQMIMLSSLPINQLFYRLFNSYIYLYILCSMDTLLFLL